MPDRPSEILAAALIVPGVLAPLGFQEAHAAKPGDIEESGNAINRAENALAQVAVQANANVEVADVSASVLVENAGCN